MLFPNPFPGHCTFYCDRISGDDSVLHPRELKIAKLFKVEKRRNEFISGRRCAQFALEKACLPKLPIFRNPNRSPAWPLSVVGSITHGAGYAAAIIAQKKSGVIGIGLDMEDLNRVIKGNITNHVLTPNEVSNWGEGKQSVNRNVRIIFSIKEAIYKCFFPVAGIYLGFHDAEVSELSQTHFEARLHKSPLPGSIRLPLVLRGRVLTTDSVVLSALKLSINELER